MTDQEQMIKTLQDELALQRRERRHSMVTELIRRGEPYLIAISQAKVLCDFIEGDEPPQAKKRGRPAKKSATKTPKKSGKKRKYTKRSKFWSKRGKNADT